MRRDKPRLLVTGGAGYLGTAVIRAAGDWEVACTRFRRPPPVDLGCEVIDLDLRKADAVARAFALWRPDAVVHTAVSNGSSEEIGCLAEVADHVAATAAAYGARLIHLSSDAVLNGLGAPYADGSAPAPMSPYGEAKTEAERRVATRHSSATIVRTSLIFGLAPLDKHNRWMVDALLAGNEVRLYRDEIVCPIWVQNLAAVVVELAGLHAPGHLNVAGSQPMSRWDFGLRILAALGMPPGPTLRQSSVADQVPARPGDRTLDVRRAAGLLRTRLLSVDEALAINLRLAAW
ncbi:MAG: sugar nucleotide-binding protein [Ardenticatenia bacterium]|nr:sugar nucleotide-binding protein [Ardenticatenia bacterium]